MNREAPVITADPDPAAALDLTGLAAALAEVDTVRAVAPGAVHAEREARQAGELAAFEGLADAVRALLTGQAVPAPGGGRAWAPVEDCRHCGAQLFRDEQGAWRDHGGGDVCGVHGYDHPHAPDPAR